MYVYVIRKVTINVNTILRMQFFFLIFDETFIFNFFIKSLSGFVKSRILFHASVTARNGHYVRTCLVV